MRNTVLDTFFKERAQLNQFIYVENVVMKHLIIYMRDFKVLIVSSWVTWHCTGIREETLTYRSNA